MFGIEKHFRCFVRWFARGFLSLFIAFAFLCSYFAPELIHSAAHALSRTEHVNERPAQGDRTAVGSVLKTATQACPFSSILSAHTSHSVFTVWQTAFLGVVSDDFSFGHFVAPRSGRLSHFSFEARGPPSAAHS
jgi:hypothetical protein